MPKVSIILPNYNHAPFLQKRIDSILSQTFKDYELIVLDDASTDNSVAVIEPFLERHSNIQFLPNTQNSGSPFAQWNKGVELAKGEYIWIAESDDFCEPTFLETMVPILDKHPKVGISYCQSYLVDEQNKKLNSYLDNLKFIYKSNDWEQSFIKSGKDACKDWLLFHNPIPNASGVLLRKSTYMEAGMADTTMRLNGDWFLYSKILSVSDLAFTSEHLNYFRVHQQTQRERSRATPSVYSEIIRINTYIKEQIPSSKANADKALNKVAAWWTGSLPYQKWNARHFKENRRLYRFFRSKRSQLILRILYTFLFTWLRNLLIAVGLLRPLKDLRKRLFPNKYFEH